MLTLGLKGLMYMSRSERVQKFPIFLFFDFICCWPQLNSSMSLPTSPKPREQRKWSLKIAQLKRFYLNNHTVDKNMHDMACFHFGDCRSEMGLKLTSFMKTPGPSCSNAG